MNTCTVQQDAGGLDPMIIPESAAMHLATLQSAPTESAPMHLATLQAEESATDEVSYVLCTIYAISVSALTPT